MWSSAAPTVPSSAWAARIRPRAAAGDSRTRSDVRTDSISCSRASASAVSHRSASTYGNVAGSAVSAMPLSGSARGTPASSSARSSEPTCAPCRRTTTASSFHGTPSSTWSRRSSRAIAACSSDVCGAVQASTVIGASRRDAASSARSTSAPPNRSANRRIGTSVVPWNEKTCASGSPATIEVGRRQPGDDRFGGERRVLIVVDQAGGRAVARRRLTPAPPAATAPRSPRRCARRSRPGTRDRSGRAHSSPSVRPCPLAPRCPRG